MYFFFTDLGSKCDIYIYIYILFNLIIIVKKILSNPWVQPEPTQPMWVGLGWTYVISWVGLC